MKIYLDANGIEGLAGKLASLGDRAQAAVADMLKVGSDFMIDGLKRGVTEYGHDAPGKSGRATGGLKESIGLKGGKIKATNDGGEAIITFNGTDARGQRYGAIAAYLNYGTSNSDGTSKITADHWIDNTVEMIKPLAQDAMKQALDRHLAKG